MTRLPRSFFERHTPDVARDMLGVRLLAVHHGSTVSGIIVETEAYRGTMDPASHAYRGRTKRNEVMFGEPGHAYVYFTYGFHNLLNVTTEPLGTPGAVLIRALQPSDGVDIMMKNRRIHQLEDLADGPGKLTQALGIDRSFNGEDLVTSNQLFLEWGERPGRIGISRRVGISQGAFCKWRFFVEGNPHVSKGKPSVFTPRTHN